MLKKLKSLLFGKSSEASPDSEIHSFSWLECGENNPFGVRFLDISSCADAMAATTSDHNIIELFASLRTSDGKTLLKTALADPCTVSCDLQFSRNGLPLSGTVFKATSMEEKWDIYIFDNVFYFSRSWSGELIFKAPFTEREGVITINTVFSRSSESDLAPSHVYFLLGSHALGLILPHRVPPELEKDELQIALWSFSMFGNKGIYATTEDITHISLNV